MLIKTLNALHETEIKNIRKLEDICKQQDKLNGDVFIDTSINFNKDIKSAYLLYDEKNELISFLYMFIPTDKEAEISAFTLPQYRRKGYFQLLLSKAYEELKKYSVPQVLFVCEEQSAAGKNTIEKLNGEYSFTEYVLKYNKDKNQNNNNIKPEIDLREVKREDLEVVIEINQDIFEEDYENTRNMVTNIIESENRIQYIASVNGEYIGAICSGFEDEEVSIFGFGIKKEFRGKGYGKEILNLLLRKLTAQGNDNLTLEVDSNNKIAYNLYKKNGFETKTAFQYYRKSVII